MTLDNAAAGMVPRINGIPLGGQDEVLTPDEWRQRACTELLRQAAQSAGLLDARDAPATDGIVSEEASRAIESLLEQNVRVPEPSEDACRRHYEAHRSAWRAGEKVLARHILFAVTPGIDVVALRKRAEAALLEVRCHDRDAEDLFARTARELSNCPSGAEGGDLGWLTTGDCAPEFSRELFGHAEVGVLPRLVHSRFGLHVVEVVRREPGADRPFEAVRGAVAMSLRQQAYITALRQYMSLLAGQAAVEGVDLDTAATPLVQ